MKYNYACCCGDEIGKKARWFPKVHWCKTCKALHIYRRTREGLYIKLRFFRRPESSHESSASKEASESAYIGTVQC